MNKLQLPISIGALGALVGVVIAEFFPKLIQLGLADSLVAGISGPFSHARNDLAVKLGLGGLVIGALIGVVLMVLKKK